MISNSMRDTKSLHCMSLMPCLSFPAPMYNIRIRSTRAVVMRGRSRMRIIEQARVFVAKRV